MVSAKLIQFALAFLSILVSLLFWAIFIQVLLSWFARGRSGLGVMLDQIVRPILRPFRFARIGMFDFSPILALLALDFIHTILENFLQSL